MLFASILLVLEMGKICFPKCQHFQVSIFFHFEAQKCQWKIGSLFLASLWIKVNLSIEMFVFQNSSFKTKTKPKKALTQAPRQDTWKEEKPLSFGLKVLQEEKCKGTSEHTQFPSMPLLHANIFLPSNFCSQISSLVTDPVVFWPVILFGSAFT